MPTEARAGEVREGLDPRSSAPVSADAPSGAAEPRAGEVWTHYKGGRYAVVGVASHSETGERLVVYHPLAPGAEAAWAARPLAMWREPVDGRPRFALEAGPA